MLSSVGTNDKGGRSSLMLGVGSPEPNSSLNPLLVIVGPTAVGKTRVSIHLAAHFGGAIVSADSRLVYKGLDIGTAKPNSGERSRIPHYLIDICLPDEILTLARYQALAYRAIHEIDRQYRLPILVGGTGQYVMAVIEGWGIPKVAPQARLRQALASLGGPELARWLRRLDPAAAERIDANNIRRVIRALEVCLTTGQPISALQAKRPPPYEVKLIGLTCERERLYQLVDMRVEQMMADGLLQEVKLLRQAGYHKRLPAFSGLGYHQLWSHLDGAMTLDEAVERIKFETHRFVRQQYTWFRLDDARISWFDIQSMGWIEAIEEHVQNWLANLGWGPSSDGRRSTRSNLPQSTP